MKPITLPALLLASGMFAAINAYCWGFYGHRKINQFAVFLLPPEMMVLYKPASTFLTEHAVDPDKRRYAVKEEGFRHYIDLDRYGAYPFDSLPRKWTDAVARFGEDSLLSHGIVPWQVQFMLARLTKAFREKDYARILVCSAELGHYISDAHVPLHANSNHNGQYTNQKGIHAFWESRVPELLAERTTHNEGFDLFIGKAQYIRDPGAYIWNRVLESAKAADSVLKFEKQLSKAFPGDRKYAFEERNATPEIPDAEGKLIRQYSSAYTRAYNEKLNGMVERRMRQSIYAVASFWFTAWVNAGQPDLKTLTSHSFSPEDLALFEKMDAEWKRGAEMIGRSE